MNQNSLEPLQMCHFVLWRSKVWVQKHILCSFIQYFLYHRQMLVRYTTQDKTCYQHYHTKCTFNSSVSTLLNNIDKQLLFVTPDSPQSWADCAKLCLPLAMVNCSYLTTSFNLIQLCYFSCLLGYGRLLSQEELFGFFALFCSDCKFTKFTKSFFHISQAPVYTK